MLILRKNRDYRAFNFNTSYHIAKQNTTHNKIIGTIYKTPTRNPLMNPFKTLLLITLTLGFTACSDKDKPSSSDSGTNNTNANTTVPTATNTTTPTQTPTPPTIDPNTPSTYKSLTLTAEQTTLNKDDNTTLKLLATLSDGTSKELNTDIEYAITPNGSAEVNNNTLTAKQDGTLTLQAKAGNTLSNTLTLTVTWTVNGHTLPPEPDKALNDATLLGLWAVNFGRICNHRSGKIKK